MLTVIHTTHDRLPHKLQANVFRALLCNAMPGMQIIIVGDDFIREAGGKRITRNPLPKSKHAMLYRNILDGLELARSDIVYCHAEADCLYPPSQWREENCEPGVIYYTNNMWRLNSEGAWPDNRTPSLSGMVADLNTTWGAIEEKYDQAMNGERIKWAEPGLGDCWTWQWAERDLPYIDVRWGGNLTGYRESQEYYQQIPYWGDVKQLQERLGL